MDSRRDHLDEIPNALTSPSPHALKQLARLLARQAAQELVGRQAEQGYSIKPGDPTETQS